MFLAAAAAGGVATSRVLAARRSGGSRTDTRHNSSVRQRWHTVTVNRPIDEVAPGGRLPEPLSRLDDVEIEVRPAPGGRGTEIAVRLRGGEPSGAAAAVATRITGDDPRHAVRRTLRETKSWLETGDVLLPDSPATTRPSLFSRPLEYATEHGREEGLL
jgi:hypothetical protein